MVSIVKILVWKPNSFLVFIYIDYIGRFTYYTYFKLFKNYKKKKKKNCIPSTKKHSQVHFYGQYQILKNEIIL